MKTNNTEPTKTQRNHGFQRSIVNCLLLLIVLTAGAGISALNAAETVLKGRILQQNSGAKAVPGVEISSLGIKPVLSDQEGRFSLVFPKNAPGDHVVIKLTKKGMEATGRDQLEVILPTKPGETTTFVMCPKNQLTTLAEKYVTSGSKIIDQHRWTHKKTISKKRLPHTRQQSMLNHLEQQRYIALDWLKEVAEKVAEVNLDAVSPFYKKVYQKLSNGSIDEAEALLTDPAIQKSAFPRVSPKERWKKGDASHLFMLKARCYILRLDFNGADQYFEKALQANPENFDHLLEYSTLCYRQNRRDKALALSEKAREAALFNTQRAAILNNLGALYQAAQRPQEALQVSRQAMDLYRRLAKQNPDAYWPDMAAILNNIGLLNLSLDHKDKALGALEQALYIREKLAAKNPPKYDLELCSTLMGLVFYYNSEAMKKDGEPMRQKGLNALNRAIQILNKYPDMPKAAKYLQIARKLKPSMEK